MMNDDLIQLVDKFLFQAKFHPISGCRNGSKGAQLNSAYIICQLPTHECVNSYVLHFSMTNQFMFFQKISISVKGGMRWMVLWRMLSGPSQGTLLA